MFYAHLGFYDSIATYQLQVFKFKYDISKAIPVQASTGLQKVEAVGISRQSAHKGDKVVSPMLQSPLYPPGDTPRTHFC